MNFAGSVMKILKFYWICYLFLIFCLLFFSASDFYFSLSFSLRSLPIFPFLHFSPRSLAFFLSPFFNLVLSFFLVASSTLFSFFFVSPFLFFSSFFFHDLISPPPSLQILFASAAFHLFPLLL